MYTVHLYVCTTYANACVIFVYDATKADMEKHSDKELSSVEVRLVRAQYCSCLVSHRNRCGDNLTTGRGSVSETLKSFTPPPSLTHSQRH